MNIVVLISSLLGVAAFLLQVATSKETLKVTVSPGSNIYLGECVFLQCKLQSNTSSAWSYWWFRNGSHLVSGDSYSITAVTREDAGSYQCQAEQREGNTTSVMLRSQPAVLSVSEWPLLSLTLTPNTRHIFRGERFTVQCPLSQTNSSGWTLRRFPPSRRVRNRVIDTDQCLPLGGAISAEECVFTADSDNGGLYWCEGSEGRSNSVSITVSSSTIILRTPASPVSVGDTVVLYCQYRIGSHIKTTFFKNGTEVFTSTSTSPDRMVEMTIENVTQEDEGVYKCASQDRKMESPESWLAVRLDPGNFTAIDGTAASTTDSWKWIVVSCGLVLLVLIPLTVWIVRRYRYQTVCTRISWSVSKEDVSTVELPETKLDVTEVQWDLSWMEMSDLLDKQKYPGN